MDERRRLKRARLIERVRTVEKGRAARVSADAEALSARLIGVAERTQVLAAHYAASHGIETGGDLRRAIAMRQQLHALGRTNDTHLAEARRRADTALTELGSAERRRARIEEDRRMLETAAFARGSNLQS